VALARCLLADAPVLILDDPISQVDFETSALITRPFAGWPAARPFSSSRTGCRLAFPTDRVLDAAG
jgi:ABC-type transport system involved in Fe-S cluster assembly fused permease/ATPase subunit